MSVSGLSLSHIQDNRNRDMHVSLLMTNKEISTKHTHAREYARTHKSPGESVSGAGDDMKKLRQGVDKVDHLRDEEEQHHLAEVSQDANHSKCHPSKIAESVSHKHR